MIYADYNGSAPLLPEVKTHLTKRLEGNLFANPNTIHSLGTELKKMMETSRAVIAEAFGAKSSEVLFTSGASEGLSHIFQSILLPVQKNAIAISAIEHSAVLEQALYYQRVWDFEVIILPVKNDGTLDLEKARQTVEKNREKLALVSVMAVNNETGVIQPYEELAQYCQQLEIPFVSDTTQLIGKMPYDFSQSHLEFAVCSGHKLGAIPGSGFILTKKSNKPRALIHGGGQERKLRGGTQNYLAIETLALACSLLKKKFELIKQFDQARNQFEENILKEFPQAKVIGKEALRVSGSTLIGLPGVHGQAVQIELESHNIFVSTSSACSDNELETSKTLRGMSVDDRLGRSVVRISLGLDCPLENYQEIEKNLISTYKKLIKLKA